MSRALPIEIPIAGGGSIRAFRGRCEANMNTARINFSEFPWDVPNVGVRSKAAVRNGQKLRLVEFTAEFVEDDWCRKGHLGYVLDGELEISFSDRTESFTSGDGIVIAAGERHRVKVTGSVARLILVEAA